MSGLVVMMGLDVAGSKMSLAETAGCGKQVLPAGSGLRESTRW